MSAKEPRSPFFVLLKCSLDFLTFFLLSWLFPSDASSFVVTSVVLLWKGHSSWCSSDTSLNAGARAHTLLYALQFFFKLHSVAVDELSTYSEPVEGNNRKDEKGSVTVLED